METLGPWLRQARETSGGTLEEASASTHIRMRFLEALEAEDFAAFSGGEVQIRGFLRIYARYLGLSPDEVVARYEARLHAAEAVSSGRIAEAQFAPPDRSVGGPATLQPGDASLSSSVARWMSPDTLMLAGIALIALLAIVTIVGYSLSQSSGREAAVDATATVTATVSSAVAMPITGTATLSTPAVTLTPTFPASPQGDVTLSLEATEHVWVRVTGDGHVAFQGLMTPGQVETWSGRERIVVETGNGAGLQVMVNEQLQGAMCGRNQVCTRAWGPTGEVAAP